MSRHRHRHKKQQVKRIADFSIMASLFLFGQMSAEKQLRKNP